MEGDGSWGWGGDRLLDAWQMVDDVGRDVPGTLEVLPDGTEAVVIGDVAGLGELSHPQGDNAFGFEGTCGICSCELVLRRFGVEVSEAELVEHAVLNGECTIADTALESGGTTLEDQVRLLSDHGVPAHAEALDSLEDLAQTVEHGHGSIIGVNAGVLWNEQVHVGDGGPNHAVAVLGVARSLDDGTVVGVFVADSGAGGTTRFVDADRMTTAWLNSGTGVAVLTDAPAPEIRERSLVTHA